MLCGLPCGFGVHTDLLTRSRVLRCEFPVAQGLQSGRSEAYAQVVVVELPTHKLYMNSYRSASASAWYSTLISTVSLLYRAAVRSPVCVCVCVDMFACSRTGM